MEIMFDDLTFEAQKRLLDEAGVSKPEDMHWDTSRRNYESQIFRIGSPMEIAVSPCKQRSPENDWTNTGQNQTSLLAVKPDLAKIIKAWPRLSRELRKAIIKMIS